MCTAQSAASTASATRIPRCGPRKGGKGTPRREAVAITWQNAAIALECVRQDAMREREP